MDQNILHGIKASLEEAKKNGTPIEDAFLQGVSEAIDENAKEKPPKSVWTTAKIGIEEEKFNKNRRIR
jgi:hypothetical protein